jgi:hypothetical protein
MAQILATGSRTGPNPVTAAPPAERGWVYVLCFGKPRHVPDGDVGHPVSHYVGWTQQVPPWRRVTSHGGARFLVSINPGTPTDEERLKASGTCALCGSPLEYRAPGVEAAGRPAWGDHATVC